MAQLRSFSSKIIFNQENRGQAAAAGLQGQLQGTLKTLRAFAPLAATAGAVKMFSSNLQASALFQSSLSELSAITGATGKDLRFLSGEAQRLGRTSIFSAVQASEAFKLVASAKPELLDNAAALSETTRQTLLLAEASGIDLPESARIVAEALNQYGKGADQAARFVNVLAAGSKRGASEVDDTAAALLKAGVNAEKAGISFETTNAAIQTLAAVGLKGEEAGTALRNIFINLQNQADDNLNPAIVGLEQALRNVGGEMLTTVEMTDLFGKRNLAAASTLIDQVDELARYEKELTGTETALEQAAIRTDNLEGDTKGLASAFNALQIQMGDEFNPVARQLTQNMTDIVNLFIETDESAEDASKGIDALEFSMDALGTSAVLIGSIFDSVGDSLGAIAAAAVRVFAGDFGGALQILEDAGQNIVDNSVEVLDTWEKLRDADRTLISTADAKIAKQRELNQVARETLALGAAAVSGDTGEGPLTSGEQAAADEETRRTEALARRLESFRMFTLSEEQIQQEAFAKGLEDLRLSLEADLVTREEFQALVEHGAAAHAKKLTAIRAKEKKVGLSTQQKFFGSMLGIQQTGILAAFGASKASAIARGVLALRESILTSYEFGSSIGGPPLGAAMAAAAGLAQAANLASLKASSPSGSGGAGGGAGGGAPAIPGPEGLPALGVASSAPAITTREIVVSVQGLEERGQISTSDVRDLMEQMAEQIGDGFVINFQGAS